MPFSKRGVGSNNVLKKNKFCVINQDLIRASDTKNSQRNKKIPSLGIDESFDAFSSNATSLQLSFQNILKIDNLQIFNNLTILNLDNNHISKIENLQFLINLHWLDLSFNNISKIQGLEKLTHLRNLSLFHNRIEKIENLEAQFKTLQCLSLGYNNITVGNDNSDQIFSFLQNFENLKILTLMQNPISNDINYKKLILSYIPSIKYLDYRLMHDGEQQGTYSSDPCHPCDIFLDAHDSLLMDECKKDVSKISDLIQAVFCKVRSLVDKLQPVEEMKKNRMQKSIPIDEIISSHDSEMKETSKIHKNEWANLNEEKDKILSIADESLLEIRLSTAARSTIPIDKESDDIKANDDIVSTKDDPNFQLDQILQHEIDNDKMIDDIIGQLKQSLSDNLSNKFELIKKYKTKLFGIMDNFFQLLNDYNQFSSEKIKNVEKHTDKCNENNSDSKENKIDHVDVSTDKNRSCESKDISASETDHFQIISLLCTNLKRDVDDIQKNVCCHEKAVCDSILCSYRESTHNRYRDRVYEIYQIKEKEHMDSGIHNISV